MRQGHRSCHPLKKKWRYIGVAEKAYKGVGRHGDIGERVPDAKIILLELLQGLLEWGR